MGGSRPGLRRTLLLVALTSATVGAFFGYNVGGVADHKRNDELAFAYELQLHTVRDLIAYARQNAIAVATTDAERVVATAARRPDLRSARDFARFERAQGAAATLARELITTMDGELAPRDEGFSRLLRRFTSGERSLARLRGRPRVRLPLMAVARDERP